MQIVVNLRIRSKKRPVKIVKENIHVDLKLVEN
jgi:hypothetical protein